MTASAAAPATAASLTFRYNPPGIMPGDGARDLTVHFAQDAGGEVAFNGAVSKLDSLARDLVPYKGRNYLYADMTGVKPEIVEAVGAVTDAYRAARPLIAEGSPYVPDSDARRPVNGQPNYTWELIAREADAAGTEHAVRFEGRFDGADQPAGIDQLEQALLDFGRVMRGI